MTASSATGDSSGDSAGNFALDARTNIGHVHLKVADLERARSFYAGVLGMKVTAELPGALFVSFSDYHHEIGLNTWSSAGGAPPPAGSTGLYHFAIRVPKRRELARVVQRLIDAGVRIDGAADHIVSEAIYLHDPDGNGIEIYCDRPREAWRWHDGRVEMATLPLDMESLMAEVEEG